MRCFRTPAKVVIFESDDWGMDRMPSRQVYDELARDGLIDTAYPFNKCGRETVDDLEKLYGVLGEFHDGSGRPAVFTTNFVMANPDFGAIKASGYRDYSWIAIDDIDRRPSQAALVAKYKEGVEQGLICPQYHGRDHLSAESWLQALHEDDPLVHAGFRRGLSMIGQRSYISSEYYECMDNDTKTSTPWPASAIDAKIETGIGIFERMFGQRPLTAIAPLYKWSAATEISLYQRGVRGMQAASHCLIAKDDPHLDALRTGFLGEQSPTGMVYLVRNCRFEPAQNGPGAMESCLRQIKTAFHLGYPAVIDTHRLNYVGVVDPVMRDAHLAMLRELLQAILSRFHDVRFKSSADLTASLIIDSGRSNGDHETTSRIPRGSVACRLLGFSRERYHWFVSKRLRRFRGGAPPQKDNPD